MLFPVADLRKIVEPYPPPPPPPPKKNIKKIVTYITNYILFYVEESEEYMRPSIVN